MKLFKKTIALMFTALVIFPAVVSAEEIVTFTEPDAVMLSKKFRYTDEEVKKAILGAVSQNDWQVLTDAPGAIQILIKGPAAGTELVLEVLYNSRKYKIKYVRSEGLQYKVGGSATIPANNSNSNFVSKNYDGGTTISSQYQDWVKQLTRSIKRQLKNADF